MPNSTFLSIHDDGIGIFKRIAQALSLQDIRFALLELSKGKFTTDPLHHSGEGIFFVSRMCDQFSIFANDLHYYHAASRSFDVLEDEVATGELGTDVRMWLSHETSRTMKEVFDEYASDSTFAFDKTIVPVRLARIGTENLVSRSQAKRLISRFDQFRVVALDFEDVGEIGQAFADELFRVFAQSHPSVSLLTMNTSEQVNLMIGRAKHNNVE